MKIKATTISYKSAEESIKRFYADFLDYDEEDELDPELVQGLEDFLRIISIRGLYIESLTKIEQTFGQNRESTYIVQFNDKWLEGAKVNRDMSYKHDFLRGLFETWETTEAKGFIDALSNPESPNHWVMGGVSLTLLIINIDN
jgi:hypothetical protein